MGWALHMCTTGSQKGKSVLMLANHLQPSFAALGLSAMGSPEPGGLPSTCLTDWDFSEHGLRCVQSRTFSVCDS